MRNRLASPEMIGAGPAAVGGVIVGLWTGLAPASSPAATFIAAGLGGLIGGAIVAVSATQRSPAALVLIGMIFSAALGGLVVLFLSTRGSGFGNVMRWIVGSTDGRTWEHVAFGSVWIGVALVVVFIASAGLLPLEFGDANAMTLGVNARSMRFVLLLAAVLLVSGSVAIAGAITFIGLLAPYIARRLVGLDGRVGVPVAALAGAVLLTGCDAIAQGVSVWSQTSETSASFGVPTGAVAAFVGAICLALVARKELPR